MARFAVLVLHVMFVAIVFLLVFECLYTACGPEPCWSDGSICALGTTCNSCCKTAHSRYSLVITACGTEPCWNDGTLFARLGNNMH